MLETTKDDNFHYFTIDDLEVTEYEQRELEDDEERVPFVVETEVKRETFDCVKMYLFFQDTSHRSGHKRVQSSSCVQ